MKNELGAQISSFRRKALAMVAVIAVCASLSGGESASAQERTMPNPGADASTTPFAQPPGSPQQRFLAFISDLHFGLGRQANGGWSPEEDFRWSSALAGFLEELGRRSANQVDLVIVGDFLELWQPPAGIACDGNNADTGCTIPEMVRIVETVVAAHANDFARLREFSKRGENRIHIIPGNHDSALLLSAVWKPVGVALDVGSGRINRVTTGVWKSPDGKVVAEHGHQIGSDVNRYPDWPAITYESGGSTFLVRPWGERFVQRVFNSQEGEYEIIDNIAPETVGVKYRIADRGYLKSTGDFARFIAFNLFETSFAQKMEALGGDSNTASNDRERWNLGIAREEIGFKLFLEALGAGDPLRAEITGNDTSSQALRNELSALARDKTRLSDDDVRALCDQLTLRDSSQKCSVGAAGAVREAQLVPRRHVMRDHVAGHLHTDERIRIFVYGHTHALEVGWPVTIEQGKEVMVHNTGAFQRTIDENGFLVRVREKRLPASEALRAVKLEDLPPCYSAVFVVYQSGIPASKTWRWHMPENGIGSLVEPGDERCN
ncbi:UDP-2,3-diacylglucosamine pyrophosphatase LpxH [Bradyrhizobium elkanii]|uniref:metallophosphoesterase n=1 Tax=Bradyrhizobium TaxID=374 RepID=UPI0021684262|nr:MULTISPECIES: metallophosphoesterase [Bradyrhizobium]MCS3932078.1 UDP-2,3-diacylglucosamine pyrophosphatase LpxH [Bradyrhizobium elkanii]MCS3972636.1 UDP-2,3-diacylglucosamine pyrophosphatase LpxH [Bradyrhizobium japonicum]